MDDFGKVFIDASTIVESRGAIVKSQHKYQLYLGMFEALCLVLSPEFPERALLGIGYYSLIPKSEIDKHREVANILCDSLCVRYKDDICCYFEFHPFTPWEGIWKWERRCGKNNTRLVYELKCAAGVVSEMSLSLPP